MQDQHILGIDVGASGIKGAIVNTKTGDFVGERYRIEMPEESTPSNVAKSIADIVSHFDYKGKVGIGFPSVIKNNVVFSAANIDKSWIGVNASKLFEDKTKCTFEIANDADLAGVAEMQLGYGKDVKGLVILITIGTGLGTALFYNGVLLPNTELGHIYLGFDMEAEQYASNSAQKREGLTWRKWGKRFNKYLIEMERLFQPDLFILGGGTSKYFDEYKTKLKVKTKVIPAKMYNNAGIVGAALYAAGKV
jgi:polyphosphate glucokinase